jgi:hypothetical protein
MVSVGLGHTDFSESRLPILLLASIDKINAKLKHQN